MTYVVLSGCIGCKHSDCVDVCPTDSFHEGPNMLVINPEDCIDCGICEPICPVDAIRLDVDVPEAELSLIELNECMSQKWPYIVKSKSAMPDAEKWQGIQNKLHLFADYDERTSNAHAIQEQTLEE